MPDIDHYEVPTGTPATLHEAFLERAAAGSDEPGGGGHALGAFLTMRLVDQFAADGDGPFSEALAYQITSTRDYLANLHPQTVELGHLQEVARLAEAAHATDNRRLLWPPMLAFGYWLEQEHRLAESLDVLETSFRLSDGRDAEEEIAAYLQRARVCRKLSRYPEATAFYREAGEMAGRRGDRHSELLGRIGQGIVLYKVGNLPQSETLLKQIIADATAIDDADAEARARHDLANAYMLMNRAEPAIPEAFRAFQLYGTEQQRIRALGDLGMALKMVEHFEAAEDAFAIVLGSRACTLEVRINTMLELLEVAARTVDRVSFERFRRELEALDDVLRPDAQADFCLKLGIGWAEFGQRSRAETSLRRAVELAEQHDLNAYLFQAEQGLARLATAKAVDALLSSVERESDEEGEAQQDVETIRVAGELHALRAATS